MNSLGSAAIPDQLKKLSEPSLDSLLEFATSCSEDPDTRTLAVTSLVISIWQLAEKHTARILPSLLFVSHLLESPSPAAQIAIQLLTQDSDSTPREQEDGPFKYGTVNEAPRRMANAFLNYHRLSRSPLPHVRRDSSQRYRDEFYAAQKAAFGYGRSRPYANSWNENLGLISDADGLVALRIETSEDIKLLKQHLQDGKTLLPPEGIGEQLTSISKTVALAGSLPLEQWDSESTFKLLELGLPFILLPDQSKDQPTIRNWRPFEFLTMIWSKAELSSITAIPQVPKNTENSRFHQLLRKRLYHLPYDYEFAINTLSRELLPLCYRLVTLAASHSPKESHPKVGEVIYKLHDETLRGITLGVESLTWHGLGLPTTHPQELLTKSLQALREKGPLTLRELQRAARIPSATARDEILAALVDVGVVRVQDKTVTAATFTEFTHDLLGRV